MDSLIEKLINFGLTKTECLVYVTLLKNGRSNGYKIAKELNISRSNVYQSIESLYRNGYIFLILTESKEYEAKAPELLFEELERKFKENAEILKKELKKIQKPQKDDYFLNIEGYENIISKLRELISVSEKEIYLNTDFDLRVIEQEIQTAVKRGVRIIVFSFNRLDWVEPPIENYYKTEVLENYKNPKRIMLVSDLEKSFIATNTEGKIKGIFTDNKVFTQIVSEHIHSDIYMSKLKKIDEEIFKKSIRIGSLHEQKTLVK